jgi:hypothetical protein
MAMCTKQDGSLIQWDKALFSIVKTISLSTILTTKANDLVSGARATSSIQSEKLSKFLKSHYRTNLNLRVLAFGWRLNEGRFCLKGLLIPLGISGRQSSAKALKIIWKMH